MAVMSFVSATKLTELINSANKGGKMYVRVLSGTRLAIGEDPMSPTSVIDLSKEEVFPFEPPKVAEPPSFPQSAIPARTSRHSGEYWYELSGKRTTAGSLRELLGHALRSIEVAHTGTLEKLCHIRPSSKRIVSRDKYKLFDSARLCDDYGEQLITGWWFGTNNSAQETNRWLQRACECAGLSWGRDFRTNLSD